LRGVARKKTPTVRVNVKALISGRLKEIRHELYGEHGGPELARLLGLPARTWYNYETGVTVPAEVLLSFIDLTGTNAVWLHNGEGPRFRRGMEDEILSELTPEQLIRRGLEKLERRSSEVVLVAPEELPSESMSDFVAVPLVPRQAVATRSTTANKVEGHILAYREWIHHPRDTIAMRLDDEAMHPILPSGSVVAIDRASCDPQALQGRIVAAIADGEALIRWLEISGRHLILRPNQPSREHPIIPIDLELKSPTSALIGQVVWSWSKFEGA
jgi:SOS-response transcriptional repressor LexA